MSGSHSGGPPPDRRRDDFSNIFGAPPPPGRSRTMTNMPESVPVGRSQTMTGRWPDRPGAGMPAPPPIPGQQFFPPSGPGHQQAQGVTGADFSRQQAPYVPFSGPGDGQRVLQPQPHLLPQPLRSDGRMTGPQRVDGGYRSHSMATHARPNMYPAYQSHGSLGQPGPGPSAQIGLPASGPGQWPHPSVQVSAPLGPGNPNVGPVSPGRSGGYKIPSSHVFRQPGRSTPGPPSSAGQPSSASGPRAGESGPPVVVAPVSGSGLGPVSVPADGRSMSMSMSVASSRQSGDIASIRNSFGREPTSARSSVSKDAGVGPRSSVGKDVAGRPLKEIVNQRSSVGKESVRISAGKMTGPKSGPGHPKSSSHPSREAAAAIRRAPVVYPALLSRVAEVFRTHINLSEKAKDGLVYKDAFTGTEAVYLLAFIIKAQELGPALLLGRALDAQKLFHDVTYAHRLRDSSSEIYQMREPAEPVNGVFTLLAECYSPTCTPFRLCYSIACPRRTEQQTRLKVKVRPGLKRQDSQSSVKDEPSEEQRLWINTVPKAVADSVDEKERKRQEIISELIYTERDFVKDLEYLRDFWIQPLWSSKSPIPEERRQKVVKTIFSNCMEVRSVNSSLADALTKRQKQDPVVHRIGDIFLQHVPMFAPFVQYGGQQLFGKHEFEMEKRRNPNFQHYVDTTERKKESRKLELNGYLTKPTTRLARYPLLLEGISKYTADTNQDKIDIPAAIVLIREVLNKVNTASGQAENRFGLDRLDEQLRFRAGEFVDLKLRDPNRNLLLRGSMKKTASDPASDLQAFLFDHAVLFVREKTAGKREELKPYRRPIPLELLAVSQPDVKTPAFPLLFRHLGRGGFDLTLFCSSAVQQQTWLDKIAEQQKLLRGRSNFYSQKPVCADFFGPLNRVLCCAAISGSRMLLGAEMGTYILDYNSSAGAKTVPVPVFDYKGVTQVDVLDQHNLVLILSDKTLYFNTVDALANPDTSPTPRSSKITPVNFFKTGFCNGQYLVSCVRSSALSTTVKVFKPIGPGQRSSRTRGLNRLFGGTKHEPLESYKVFYIPSDSTSLHYLRSKMCVGCTRGFEVVSLDPIETQSLLDQADTSLDFVRKRENVRPIHIERLDGTFLLCYSEFSFFVDRNGWRVRPEFFISWEGTPTAFAVVNTYILAFEPSFIEVRHLDTGVLMSVITARNVRMLYASKEVILYAYENPAGNDVIALLDFWNPAPEDMSGLNSGRDDRATVSSEPMMPVRTASLVTASTVTAVENMAPETQTF